MPVSFTQSTLAGELGINGPPSALQWGPDGKLYVASRFGQIAVLEVEKTGPGAYTITSSEIIDAVRQMPNHDDDGSLAGADDDGFASLRASDPDALAANQRQVTGLVVGGTAENPVLYVSSSDPRIGAGNGGMDTGLDTNSGVVSRLTPKAGGGWDKVDIVRGLPRSEENHATNGLALGPDGTKLLLTIGGNTNAGAPSAKFAGQVEYALSAAILEIDLTKIAQVEASQGVKTYAVPGFPAQKYVYDLPTLNDPTRPDGPQGQDLPGSGSVGGDPFGGNDGLNMAKLVAGGPVRVFSPGYRNPYDVLVTEDGRIWSYDNSANTSWGGLPLDQNGNAYTGAPGQVATNLPGEAQFGQVDGKNQLHEVVDGFYAGHPNLIRAYGAQAGLLETPGSGTTGASLHGPGELPSDFAGVVDPSLLNPEEALYLEGGENDGALDTDVGSVNGLAEYTASTLFSDGQGGTVSLKGAILATNYGPDQLVIINRYADGDGDVETGLSGDKAVAQNRQVIQLDGGGGPLGIDAVGDGGPFAGTIWITRLNNGDIVILEPSGVAAPPDSDLDDDGLDNVVDRFARDATNGTGTVISAGTTRVYNFESGSGEFPGTEGGIGFTGAMVNGTDAYENGGLINLQNLILGGAAGVMSIKKVQAGDAHKGDDSQKDALQFGVALDASVGTVSFTTTMSNWLIGDDGQNLPLGGTPSAGLFIGTGDQDNYVKLVVAGRSTPAGPKALIQQLFESGGAVQNAAGGADPTDAFKANALLAQADPDSNVTWIQLRLTVDKVAGTVTPSWRFGTDADRDPVTGALPDEAAAPFQAGNTFAATGDLLAAINGAYEVGGQASGLAVGILGTSKNGTPFTANFDEIVVSSPPAEPPPTGAGSAAVSVNAGSNSLGGATSVTANSFVVENTSSGDVTITKVEFRMAADGPDGAFHSLLPNIVFDPKTDTDGLVAGDTGTKDFTRDAGSVGTFGVTPTLSGGFSGGYKVLTLDFTGFDPGETLAFSIDADPVSIKGGTRQSANGAGAIAGVEQVGVPVTITFSDGTTRTAELFTDGSKAGVEAFVRAGLASAPTLSIPGVLGGEAVVSSLQQTVTVAGGTPNGTAKILVVEAGAFPVLDPVNGYAFDDFEANRAVAIRSKTVQLDGAGGWTGTVALSDGPAADDGINYITAAMVDADGNVAGLVSDRLALRVDMGGDMMFA